MPDGTTLPPSVAVPVSHPQNRLPGWLALGAVGLLLIALAFLAMGRGEFATAIAMAGVTAGLLAAAFALMSRRSRGALDGSGAALSQLLALDPDAICLSDLAGTVSAANPQAASQPLLAARLADWCVDPERTVLTLLAEAAESGNAIREFRRQGNGLRVVVHRIDGAAPLALWRFSRLNGSENRRGVEALGWPILSRDSAGITANAAARQVLDSDLSQAAPIVEAAEKAPAEAVLADGTRLRAVSLAARDGVLDVLLLPESMAVNPGLRRDPAGSAFDDIPVALAQIGVDGRLSATNRLARQLLGLSPGDSRFLWEVVEGLGRPVADWLDDARAGRALGRPEVMRAPLTGQETFVQIILRRGLNGALMAVISDATELKSLEARFVQSQKMQAIGQLAGGVAHDFNNLLTAIAGHCDLLLLNRDRFDPDYDDLLQIHQNSNRAAALVRQLLAFSRKQTLKTELLTLESLLEDLTHLLTRLVGERVSLVLDHDPDVGAIRADRRQLEQVIMNLVVNARDAMPMGGTIRLETRMRRLTTDEEHGRARLAAGDYAVIRVIDHGVGISAEIIDKIFEPFFTTKKLGEGTGLGLSTAYGIVKQMGGYIFCDSVEGAGTTFTLYFALAEPGPGRVGGPVASDALAFEPDTRRTDALAQGSRRVERRRPMPAVEHPPTLARGRAILLVEDEAPVRAFAARALRHQGYQVFEAQDGEQALEFLADSSVHVDLFVTDVIMPGIDGPGWVSQALAARPETPVVFVSGYTEDTLSAALARIPRSVFLGKPFSLSDLTTTIARQLDS